MFKQYWANPSYGLPDVPGCFFRYTFGSVDFFFLDVRYYRDPNKATDTPQKTMLGEKQLQWLKAELEDSRATFKLLILGSGWSAAKGPAELIFRLMDSKGHSVWEPFVLRAEELSNGVASWQTKVDNREKQRQENYELGKGYYERGTRY